MCDPRRGRPEPSASESAPTTEATREAPTDRGGIPVLRAVPRMGRRGSRTDGLHALRPNLRQTFGLGGVPAGEPARQTDHGTPGGASLAESSKPRSGQGATNHRSTRSVAVDVLDLAKPASPAKSALRRCHLPKLHVCKLPNRVNAQRLKWLSQILKLRKRLHATLTSANRRPNQLRARASERTSTAGSARSEPKTSSMVAPMASTGWTEKDS